MAGATEARSLSWPILRASRAGPKAAFVIPESAARRLSGILGAWGTRRSRLSHALGRDDDLRVPDRALAIITKRNNKPSIDGTSVRTGL